MMSSLLSLGKSHFLLFAKEWLSIKEACCLDSAYCEMSKRIAFLHHFEHYIVHDLGCISDLKFPLSYFDWLAKRGVSLTDLSTVGGNLGLYVSICEEHKNFFISVSSLTVNNCSVTQFHKKLFLVVSNCLNLKILSVSGCERVTESNSVGTLLNSGICCSQLAQFNLTDFTMLSNVSINALVADCSEITHLNLSGCQNLSDECVAQINRKNNVHLKVILLRGCAKLTDSTLVSIAEHCVNVETLAVSAVNMSNASVEALVKSCNKITSLELVGDENSVIDDQSMDLVSTNLPLLTSLNLSNNKAIGVDGLQLILTRCLLLSSLDISGLPAVVVDDISFDMADAKHLTRIRFGGNDLRWFDVLNVFAELVPKFSEITVFHFSEGLIEGTRRVEGTTAIDDSSSRGCLLLSIIPLCGNLQSLEYQTKFRSTVIDHFYPNCLRFLRVFKCTDDVSTAKIYDDELRMLARYTILLTEIDFSGCRFISDYGMIVLFAANRQLSKVNLDNCVKLTDVCIVSLAKQCRNLEYLSVCSCGNITDTAMDALAAHSRCLVEIDVSHTQVSAAATDKLLSKCLGLRKVSRNTGTE